MKPRTLRWGYKGRSHVSTVLPSPCPFCRAVAIIELPEAVRAEQPDDTTHVCHPMAGGCNHGFSDLPLQGACSCAGEIFHVRDCPLHVPPHFQGETS